MAPDATNTMPASATPAPIADDDPEDTVTAYLDFAGKRKILVRSNGCVPLPEQIRRS